MANRQFNMPDFKPGMYMSWSISAQASYAHTITLKDSSGKMYFSHEKGSGSSAFAFLEQGHGDVTGTLTLTDDCPEASALNASINACAITDAAGNTVGRSYEFCIEDSNDADYNDIYINLVAWNKKG